MTLKGVEISIFELLKVMNQLSSDRLSETVEINLSLSFIMVTF